AGLVLRAFLGDLLLAEEVDPDVDEPAGEVVEARPRVRSAGGDRAPEQPHGAREERQRRDEKKQEQDLRHGSRNTMRRKALQRDAFTLRDLLMRHVSLSFGPQTVMVKGPSYG